MTKQEFDNLKNGDHIVIKDGDGMVKDGQVFMKGNDVAECIFIMDSAYKSKRLHYKDIEIPGKEEKKEEKPTMSETYGERVRNLLSPYRMLIDMAKLNNWLSDEQMDIQEKTIARLIKFSHHDLLENNFIKEDEEI